MKNTFPLYGKAASTLKNIWWDWFPLAGIWFVFQNGLPPNFNNGVYLQKKTRNKIIDKTDKNLVSIFPICSSQRETASTGSSWLLFKKMEENGFHKPKNQFSLVKNMVFLQKLASINLSDGFHRGKTLSKRKRFSVARKSISRNEGFRWKIPDRKKLTGVFEKWRKTMVSTSRKILFPYHG